jgi:hypothetical protein
LNLAFHKPTSITSVNTQENLETERITTKEGPITSKEDTGVVPAKIISTLPMYKTIATYPIGEVTEALLHPYEVASFNWTTGMVLNDLIGQLDFPAALLTKPFIVQKLSWFKYYRYNIMVTLETRCTKFDYGLAFFNFIPFYFPSATVNWRSKIVQAMYQSNCYKFSLAQGISKDIPMGWISPYQWHETSSGAPELGTLTGRVLFPIRSSMKDGAHGKQVKITARFVDIEPTGLAPDVEPAAILYKQEYRQFLLTEMAKRDKAIRSNAKPQSAPPDREASQKSSTGLLSGIVETATSFAPLIGAVAPEFLPFASLAQSLGPTVSGLFKAVGLNKPATVSAQQPFYEDPFADMPYGKGLDTARKLSLDPDARVTVQKNIAGTDDPMPTIAGICRRPGIIMHGTFTNASPAVIINEVHTPMKGIVLSSTATRKLSQPIPAAHYAKYCSRWRGSMKWQLTIDIPDTIKTKIFVSHRFEPTTTPYAGLSGDLYAQKFDVCGHTVIEYTTLWLCPEDWANVYSMTDTDNEVPGTIPNGRFHVERIADIESSDPGNDPPVTFYLTCAMGEDFQLQQLIGPHMTQDAGYHVFFPVTLPIFADKKKRKGGDPRTRFRKTEASNADPQCETESFMKAFPALAPNKYVAEQGVCNPENIMGPLATWLHRWSQRADTYPGPTDFGSWQPDYVPGDMNGYFVPLILPFMFWRGGLRHKFIGFSPDEMFAYSQCPLTNVETFNYETFDPYPAAFYQGSNRKYPSSQPDGLLTVETPFYSRLHFMETLPTMITGGDDRQFCMTVQYPPGLVPLMAAADDFSVGTFMAVPMLEYDVESPPVMFKQKHRSIFTVNDIVDYKHKLVKHKMGLLLERAPPSNASPVVSKEKEESLIRSAARVSSKLKAAESSGLKNNE